MRSRPCPSPSQSPSPRGASRTLRDSNPGRPRSRSRERSRGDLERTSADPERTRADPEGRRSPRSSAGPDAGALLVAGASPRVSRAELAFGTAEPHPARRSSADSRPEPEHTLLDADALPTARTGGVART